MAKRFFTAALDARADFVLLVGDLLNPMGTGAWGPAFLLSQFERLAAAKNSDLLGHRRRRSGRALAGGGNAAGARHPL
jgi:hypothetical protein